MVCQDPFWIFFKKIFSTFTAPWLPYALGRVSLRVLPAISVVLPLLYHNLGGLSSIFFRGGGGSWTHFLQKANVSKVATLLYLSLRIGGSPFYLTAICALIVSYFKGFVKGFLRFSLIFFKGETNAAWLLPLSLLLRKVGVLTSPWRPYCITIWAICQELFSSSFWWRWRGSNSHTLSGVQLPRLF